MSTNQNELATKTAEVSMSERFTSAILKEFGSNVGVPELTNSQKRLAQNYFIAIDEALTNAEQKRADKKTNQDPLPVIWKNTDLNAVAQGVVSCARIGWDPLQDNHVSIIPFKDNSANKYKITFMPGYRGLELKAKKYGLDVPDHVVVELVYSTDKFKMTKKDSKNECDMYEFEITNPFDRGQIIGGFYYHVYLDNPTKNKLAVFSMTDIEKRKPKYASVEFWGGEKDEWENGKKTGKKVHIDGWRDKMCYKTIYRAAYNDITIDSNKIDEDFLRIKQTEMDFAKAEVDAEVSENANTICIDDAIIADTKPLTAAEPTGIAEELAELDEPNF